MSSRMKSRSTDKEGDGGPQKKVFNLSSPEYLADINNPIKRVCATCNTLSSFHKNADNGENQDQNNPSDNQGNWGSSNNEIPSKEMGTDVLLTYLLRTHVDQCKDDSHIDTMEEECHRESSRCEQVHGKNHVQEVLIKG